ncbi:hypothetical protein RHGRI_022142 [Rhododendron griersonianum]|uniref:GDSL esterase/lipase n=1 Tax=Rhododendron griersonianum TaxID=479676 RepID=A0AAV6JSN9_9ERIC|nr:hypothetical protein RHGRI_022142 [Rhododendron griersonianum]
MGWMNMGYMALMFVVCACFVSSFVFHFSLPGVPTYLKNEEDLGNSIVKTVSRAAPAPANVSLGDLQGRPLFVFGDSTVDAGNFNITKLPYGVDYHTLGPRFSNGLTIADYLALKIQTAIPQAFNSMGKEELKKNVNVNFASAGCGLLAKTHPMGPIPCTSFGDQVMQFLTSTSKNERSVFFISVGANDYVFSFDRKNSTQFAEEVLSKLEIYLKVLYSFGGARIFIVNNLAPVGCIPDKRNSTTNRCDEVLNKGVNAFNRHLEQTLWNFKKERNAAVFLADSHLMYAQIRNDPTEFGFTEIYKPCCGIWNANLRMFACGENTTYCHPRTGLLFFDGAHTTDQANNLFVKRCFAGRLCYPIRAPTV